MHGVEVSVEPVNLAGIAPRRLGLIGNALRMRAETERVLRRPGMISFAVRR